MNAREKARLSRIIDANATAYRSDRQQIALAVMRGEQGQPRVGELGRSMVWHAQMIAEAVADLQAHADPDREQKEAP
jgi:hypothetical protein